MPDRFVLNVPNALTIARIVAIPVFVVVMLGTDDGHSVAAAGSDRRDSPMKRTSRDASVLIPSLRRLGSPLHAGDNLG